MADPAPIPAEADHGPARPPRGPWVMTQRWHDLLFAHWPVPAEVLRPLIPQALALDTFDGSAWIAVVPFRMTGIRLRCLPPLPGTSRFPELNVRTYVTYGGRPGVWFLSLDAANRLAVATARAWFHLPYFHARMRCEPHGREDIAYASRRSAGGAEFTGRYGPVGAVEPAARGSLEAFLVERYHLYAVTGRGAILRGDIHHAPWPLQPAQAEIEVNTMTAPPGIRLPATRPLLHFARELRVRIWAPRAAEGRHE